MKITKRSVLCLAILTALAACSDDKIIETDSGYSPVVAEGKTLTNTPDIVVKSENEVEELTITIGATSDIHGRIWGHDYATDKEDKDAGLTRISTILEQYKAQNPDMILVDIGDTVQGNSAHLFNDDPTHPVVSTLNALAYDLWVPGNHEFDFERSFIDRNLTHFNGAVVSSNIKWESNSANYIRPYQIFEIDGARVAVVGVTPSNVPNWQASSPGNFKDLTFEEELASTRAAVDDAISKYSPDVIIGTFHIGRDDDNGAGVHRIAAELADKFDVILAGHEHATYIESVEKLTAGEDIQTKDISSESAHIDEDKSLSGVYDESNRHESVKIIEPGKWGWGLATAQIKLEKDDSGKWQMVDTTLANITSEEVNQDQAVQAQFQYVHDISRADATQILGTVTGNFTPSSDGSGGADEATSEDMIAGRLYTTIHTAKVEDTAVMGFIHNVQLEKSGAQISAAALFADNSNLLDGQDYAKMDSTKLYLYDNNLMGVNMTGENLKRFMEFSYTYFNGYQAGDITVSFPADARAYMYDQFNGDIQFVVDLAGTAQEMDDDNNITVKGSRIEITEVAGAPFDPNATYKVALNNYRWGSQIRSFGWATDADIFYDSVNEPVYAIRDMLSEYVETNQGVDANSFANRSWEIKQYQEDGAITLLRNDDAKGQALWQKLINKQVCVVVAQQSRDGAISQSVNINDDSSYYVNPNADSSDIEEVYKGCN